MTKEELQAIRERCAAATPGPWIAKGFNPYRNRAAIYQTPDAQKVNPLHWQVAAICREARAQDADFIQHARADIPALLAEIERLRGERRTLWKFVKPVEGARLVYLGVHAVRWHEAAGEYEPTAGFVQADSGEESEVQS